MMAASVCLREKAYKNKKNKKYGRLALRYVGRNKLEPNPSYQKPSAHLQRNDVRDLPFKTVEKPDWPSFRDLMLHQKHVGLRNTDDDKETLRIDPGSRSPFLNILPSTYDWQNIQDGKAFGWPTPNGVYIFENAYKASAFPWTLFRNCMGMNRTGLSHMSKRLVGAGNVGNIVYSFLPGIGTFGVYIYIQFITPSTLKFLETVVSPSYISFIVDSKTRFVAKEMEFFRMIQSDKSTKVICRDHNICREYLSDQVFYVPEETCAPCKSCSTLGYTVQNIVAQNYRKTPGPYIFIASSSTTALKDDSCFRAYVVAQRVSVTRSSRAHSDRYDDDIDRWLDIITSNVTKTSI